MSYGHPWVYDLASGRAQEIETKAGTAETIAWSPNEDVLAISSSNIIDIVSVAQGSYSVSDSFSLEGTTRATTSIISLSWHPDGQRLLASAKAENDMAFAMEIALSSRAMDGGFGMASYGPGGRWILWRGKANVGHQEDTILAREDRDGKLFPLAKADETLLKQLQPAAGGLWFSSTTGTTETFYSFDASGRLRRVAQLPKSSCSCGRDPNPAMTLFAESRWNKKDVMILRIVDAKGRQVAGSERAVAAVQAQIPSAEDTAPKGESGAENQYSRVAWSPNGQWLAWTINGRLCLWNWRNDIVRILPELSKPAVE